VSTSTKRVKMEEVPAREGLSLRERLSLKSDVMKTCLETLKKREDDDEAL